MKPNLSVLVVDDEAHTVDLLLEEFSPLYNVSSASSGLKAWSSIEKTVPDLVLLGMSLPEMSGLELCKKMRASVKCRDVPVFFLSECPELATLVSAFEFGADDYIEKPFRIEELKARVASKLRSKVGHYSDVIHCGNLKLSGSARKVEINNISLEFSSLEFRLLRFFLENPDRVIKRQEILESVWRGEPISTER